MSILIDSVRISGFRAISAIEINLQKVTLLIGTNNSGKTSIITALRLALGSYARHLNDEDFHIDSNDVRCEKIVIDVRIIPFDSNGARLQSFDDEWTQVFGEQIRAENDDKQFVAWRTVAKVDEIKGGFIIERCKLDKWIDLAAWKATSEKFFQKMRRLYDALPVISIDAQRDIHQELKDKSSFIGKVLSSVTYDKSDVLQLEKMISEVNKEAIEKSKTLNLLKKHLDKLRLSFEGNGETDLTPFPKKIRDLSNRFNVNFGESQKNSLPMEYHGMGTRSWASMLTVKAHIDLIAENHKDEVIQFFPTLVIEEPEAHLHPNAQRTLYEQLIDSPGQIVISTHSPYLAAMASLKGIRGIIKRGDVMHINSLMTELDSAEIKILQREILRFRGEIFFSKALILVEGVTEEQLVPAMYQLKYGNSAFSKGINCISVGGKNYPPFIKFACNFGIPTCIVSDNDRSTQEELEGQLEKIRRLGFRIDTGNFSLHLLGAGNDIEAELVHDLDIRNELEEALVLTATKGNPNPRYNEAKKKELESLSDEKLLELMRHKKASYAGFLAEIIVDNPNEKNADELIPLALLEAFNKIESWLNA